MDTIDYSGISPCTLGNILPTTQFMAHDLHPLWDGCRLAGPAYTVRLPPGENLALHASIYRAPAGSVLVVQAGDLNYAVAGGNVCAVAQTNGIAGMIVDGVIRDRAEIRAMRFPVFARGVRPIPGGKNKLGEWQVTVQCGGVTVHPGDVMVADEEGIACVPERDAVAVLEQARARQTRDATLSFEDWAKNHRETIAEALAQHERSGEVELAQF